TFVTSSSLAVNLYGAPQHRRVETESAPLKLVSDPPVERTIDKSLAPGEEVIDDYGEAAYSTSVQRKVYSPSGKLLYDNTWYSNYVSSPELVRVGPARKAPPPKKKKQPPEQKQEPTTTTTTTTTTTEATPPQIATMH